MADFSFRQLNTTARLMKAVQQCWMGEVSNAPGEQFTHIAIAQSRAQLLIHYEGEFKTAAQPGKHLAVGLYGPTTSHRQYTTASRKAGIFGIQLTATAIPALFGIPAAELTDQAVAPADILGRRGADLEEKLLAAGTNVERTRIIHSFLEASLEPMKEKYGGIAHAVDYIHCMQGLVKVEKLIDLACLSPRQFERNFKELTGFSASTYLRIIRFEHAIHTFSGPQQSLTDLSLACGYYDQAHFNRDFKAFTGLTPHQYMAFHPPSG